jgi:uncharacterized protein (DUF2141 family)
VESILPSLIFRGGVIAASVAIVATPWIFSSAAEAQGSPLTIQVYGVPSSEGSVRANVCTSHTFLKGDCPYSGVAPAVEGETTVTVEGVPPGVYAVQLYHDRHDLGHVDRGVFGIPKESIGFSNNAPLGFKGPRFSRASFTHGGGPQTITVSLKHFGPGSRPASPIQDTTAQ